MLLSDEQNIDGEWDVEATNPQSLFTSFPRLPTWLECSLIYLQIKHAKLVLIMQMSLCIDVDWDCLLVGFVIKWNEEKNCSVQN